MLRRLRILVPALLALPLLAYAAPPVKLPLRGFLVDSAWMPETMDYYRRLVRFCADWGMNVLVFRVADDQGSVIRFSSHPELIYHKNGFTPDEVRGLVSYAKQYGVEVIPELESFGHTEYITRVPEHAGLEDRDPSRGGFTGLIPTHSEGLRIIADLYREMATIFPSVYLHGGCDEVNWGHSEYSKNLLKAQTKPQVFAEHVNMLNKLAKAQGRELIVWADHVLYKEPSILPHLDKDIILYDWNYWETDPAVLEKTARKAIDSGHRIIGGPAWGWARFGPRVDSQQLGNIDAFVDAYRRIDEARDLGVIVTNWIPSRYLQNSIWDGIAYAGVALNEGSAAARDTAFRRFAERHYGTVWNGTWADMFRSVYDLAPRMSLGPGYAGPPMPIPWSDQDGLTAAVKHSTSQIPPFTRLLGQMKMCQSEVKRNFADFQAFQLSVEYIENAFWRQVMPGLESRGNPTRESTADLIRTIAERDRQLVDALNAEWNRGRFQDAPHLTHDMRALSDNSTPMGQEQLLFNMREAARFSSQLAVDPERFYDILLRARSSSNEGGMAMRPYSRQPADGPKP
jgi:glycosyl hydrolase family 20